MKRLLLLAPALLAGCIEPLYDSLDENAPTTGTTSTGTADDTTGQPLPTTGTTTVGVEQDMAVEPDTTDAAAYVEIVAFSASTNKMLRAGSVLLTAEVEGDVTELMLQVHHDGEQVDSPSWPVGESIREYIINSDELDGEIEFTLTAKSGQLANDTASLTVDVDLPESGTVDFRWVSPAVSKGVALAVVPSSGMAADKIVAVANDPDDVLLLGAIDSGEVAMKQRAAMKVRAVDVADGFLFVAGERDGEMVVRKYTAETLQQYWENDYPNARAFDVAVGADGDVFVVGEADVDEMLPHTEAALWTLTESGSFLHEVALFAEHDEWDWPFSSALHAVGFQGDRVVAAGYREAYVGAYPPRATLFEFADGVLTDRDVYSGSFLKEECGWHSLVSTKTGIYATGWHKGQEIDPTSVAVGRYGDDLAGEVFSPAWGGFGGGNAVAWQHDGDEGYPMIAGHRTVDLEPRLLVQAEAWAQPYIDDGGDRSWAHDVVIDRHGYIYVIGDLVEDGSSHVVLLRLHP